MSGDQRQKSANLGPILIHDCHAEILARRALQVWIWDNLENHSYFESGKLLPHLSLHFYSSTPPCGDCCVHQQNDLVSVQTGAKPFGWSQSQLADSPPNIVRGKPGRGSRSQSVSCSEKICLWIHAGVQGSLLSLFVPILNIESICIGDGNLSSIKRAFIDRIKKENHTKSDSVKYPHFFVGKPTWEQKNMSPSASSFVWWPNGKSGELIAAKFGRKLGVTSKKQEERKFFSELCDAVMLERFCKRQKISKLSIREAKEKCENYQQKKKEIIETLISFGGEWATKFDEEKIWEYKE